MDSRTDHPVCNCLSDLLCLQTGMEPMSAVGNYSGRIFWIIVWSRASYRNAGRCKKRTGNIFVLIGEVKKYLFPGGAYKRTLILNDKHKEEGFGFLFCCAKRGEGMAATRLIVLLGLDRYHGKSGPYCRRSTVKA